MDIPTSDKIQCDGAELTVMNGLKSDVTGMNDMRRVCGTGDFTPRPIAAWGTPKPPSCVGPNNEHSAVTRNAAEYSYHASSVGYNGYTSTNALVLKFENSVGRTGRGFTLDYRITPSTDIACVGAYPLTMDASPGTIVSPPNEHGRYRKCEWRINAPNEKVVNLVFRSINFDILNGKCGSDPTLTFWDGVLRTDPMIYRICSYRKQVSGIPQIASTGPFMYIRFVNIFGHFAKFEVSYTFTDPPPRSLSGSQIVGLVLGIMVVILLIFMIFVVVHIKKTRMTRRAVVAARYRALDTLDRRRHLQIRNRQASTSPRLPCTSVLAPDVVPMKPPDYTDLPPPSYEQVVAQTATSYEQAGAQTTTTQV